jgi:glycerol-3-phosphate acyltransferase PlsY
MIREIGLLGNRYGEWLSDEAQEMLAFRWTSWSVILPVLAAVMVLGYLLGSLNFAVLISRHGYHEDIRDFGSKNAGTTNMMRTYGKKAAGLTLLGDVLKGVFASGIGSLLLGQMGGYFAGFCCIVGHMYPVWFRFRGGKGIATTAGVVLWLSPGTFGVLLFLFVAIVLWTKYVSLGSIMALLMYPFILDRFSTPPISELSTYVCFPPRVLVALAIMVLAVWKHRTNIKRLWNKEENKFSFHSSKK